MRFSAYALAPMLAVAWLGLVLWPHAQQPVSDAGGYEQMLRYFFVSGKVDYMRWCQPTFVGLLPLATVWRGLFGLSTPSLAAMSLLYTLLLVMGVYVFCRRFLPPPVASLLALSMVVFPEVAGMSCSFMTDIPYLACLVWFLVLHRCLEEDYQRQGAPSSVWKWVAWVMLLGTAAAIRTFALISLGAFLLQSIRPSREVRFARTCLGLGLATGVVCVMVIRLLGQNAFSSSELTVMHLLIAHHDWKRFDVRATTVGILFGLFSLAPVLWLLPTSSPKWRAWVALAALLLGGYLWRRGLLDFPVPLVGLGTVLSLAVVMLAAVGAPRLVEMVGRPQDVACPLTGQLLLTLATAQILIMPIMLHPLTRHVLPALVVLTLYAACRGMAPSRLALTISFATVIGMLVIQGAAAADAEDVNTAVWQHCDRLVTSGVRADAIAGGWSWFCAHNLVPGRQPPIDYVAVFTQMEAGQADYSVKPFFGAEPAAGAVDALHTSFLGISCPYRISVLKDAHHSDPP